MFSHYPQQGGGNAVTAAQDWIEDMGSVSAKAFREAVRRWRRDPNAFKPSPGQLLALIDKLEEPIRKRLEDLEEIETETVRMSDADRLNHLKQWLYELELGHVPYDVHRKGHDEIQRYLAAEKAIVKSEIATLERDA